MMCATAKALIKNEGTIRSSKDSVALMATVGLARDDYDVLRAISFSPAITINVLQHMLPNVPVHKTVDSLRRRSLIHACGVPVVMTLTRIGWMLLTAAEWLIRKTLDD